MPDVLKTLYGTTEGPLGFPMSDRAARDLDAVLRSLPKTAGYEYRHLVVTRGPTELHPGERSDVSWISTESVDRAGEVVRARGFDDRHFRTNPVVTWQHAYHLPPVGKSLWRKRVHDGPLAGIKAKTHYPPRPDGWSPGEPWPPDQAFALISAGLLNGKSIGFLPTKVHAPDEQEAKRNGWDNVTLVIDEWLLLEYACCFLPVNQDALVEAVAKGLPVSPEFLAQVGVSVQKILESRIIPFTPLAEIEKHVRRRLAHLDPAALAGRALAAGLDRARGRV
jgi:hypothetical protein